MKHYPIIPEDDYLSYQLKPSGQPYYQIKRQLIYFPR